MPVVWVLRDPERVPAERFDRREFNAALRDSLERHFSAPGRPLDQRWIDIHHSERSPHDEAFWGLVVIIEIDQSWLSGTPQTVSENIGHELALAVPDDVRFACNVRPVHDGWATFIEGRTG